MDAADAVRAELCQSAPDSDVQHSQFHATATVAQFCSHCAGPGLDDIWEYIAADTIDAADRWIGKLFDAFEALGQTPGMGHRRDAKT